MTVPTVLWLLAAAAGWSEKLTLDTGEKRNMHKLAKELTPANLSEELEQTYNDHLPFRSVLLKADRKLERVLEKPYRDGIEPALISAVNGGGEGDASEDAMEYFPYRELPGGVVRGRGGFQDRSDIIKNALRHLPRAVGRDARGFPLGEIADHVSEDAEKFSPDPGGIGLGEDPDPLRLCREGIGVVVFI